MDKQTVISIITDKIKLVRVEMDYTQDKMAEVLGVSKKTLVQIEKGRSTAGWTVIVAVCALFRESEVLQSALGGDPLEVAETIARDGLNYRKEKTLGGKVWWKVIARDQSYILQQNMISHHFRILDEDNYRIYSTFEENEAKARFEELIEDEKR
ncbi:helix-turn-helix transcriptional regulator [Peribacillus sp. SCS-155]|uniref:helix-turn-helix transcriptional regulator n=1 Tax=Peribacillus sedimenti TaxID=3115297 RepID=UPI003905F35F